LQDALNKPTIESKEHVSTHNEVIKLVEAAWLIHQNRNGKNRPRSKIDIRIYEQGDDVLIEDKFNKPKRLIEKAADDPVHVIQEVFKAESLNFFKEAMRDWLHVGLISESIRYQFGGQRSYLLDFHTKLLLLVEALYVTNEHHQTGKRNGTNDAFPVLLTDDQIANPDSVITDFFKEFPVQYIRRELYDWCYAAIAFSGTWPDDLCPQMVFDLYDYLSCLTEAAFNLSQRCKGAKEIQISRCV
jgi:hypothetical protein